jgi:hypothetical protein
LRIEKEIKKLEVWRNIITPALPGGSTLSAQIGCPDEEMWSGKLMEKLILYNGKGKRKDGILGISRLSVIHEGTSIFIYPHDFT